jgi:hypothetical protein
MAELEYKYCIALNCKGYPTHDGSPIYNAMLDYIELFYDKADVIADLVPYLKLFQVEDAQALRDKIRQKVENLETTSSNILPDIKLIRWKFCLIKLSKITGAYHSYDRTDKLKVVNGIIQTYFYGYA